MTKNLIRKAIECIVDGEYGIAELALREALAESEALDHFCDATKMVAEQAEQEPVAWFRYESTYEYQNKLSRCTKDCFGAFPVYAAPVHTKDLTDDEIQKACDNSLGELSNIKENYKELCWYRLGVARAVIAAYKEKNRA